MRTSTNEPGRYTGNLNSHSTSDTSNAASTAATALGDSAANGAGDSAAAILADINTVSRIDAVQLMLRLVSDTTGMGFAAVARVTGDSWTACAVHDHIQFGMRPGDQLELSTTLCNEVRLARQSVAIDHVAQDLVYSQHHTPRMYGFQSYVSVPIVLPDGQYFGNLCAIGPQPAQVSGPQVMGMFQSFAALIGVQVQVERQREADEAALRDEKMLGAMREQFMAVLSHDLRNPLNAITACGHLLKRRSADPAAVLDIAARIERSSRRMALLIDETLDLARSRAPGGLGVRRKPVVDLEDALNMVVAELQVANPNRSVLSDICIPGVVHCDSGRVQQVLSNLLANALLHGSPTEPVHVTGTTTADQLVLQVLNQGTPLSDVDKERALSPFWRPQAGHARVGLGVGLYICSQVAREHGGTLDCESDATGTRFTLRLPLGPELAAAAAQDPAPAPASLSAG